MVIGQLSYGGAESQLYELARGLSDRFEPVVYCLSKRDEPYGGRLRDAGVRVRVIASRGSFDVARIFRLARYFREDGIDLAHAFLFIASAYAYLASLLVPRVKLVASARNCKPERNCVRRRVIKSAFCRASAIVCNSGEMARFAQEHYGAPREKLRIVYNGVDLARFSPRRAAPGAPLVGTVGRLEPQKNLDMFIEAAGAVLQTGTHALFEIVGEGALAGAYERKIASAGLAGAVSLVGVTADTPGFLSRLSQFWLTSNWEGTPNVVLEAMAAGVPVIATAVGGTPEIVEDGGSGFLVAPGDARRLCELSVALFSDAELSARLGRRGRCLAEERFSLPVMVEATERIYESVLGWQADVERRSSAAGRAAGDEGRDR